MRNLPTTESKAVETITAGEPAPPAALPPDAVVPMKGGAIGVVPLNTGDTISGRQSLESSVLYADKPGPKVVRYQVVNGGFIMMNNCRTLLKQGKVLDGRTYDLKALKSQGIVLKPFEE